jgi:hypothetical protein
MNEATMASGAFQGLGLDWVLLIRYHLEFPPSLYVGGCGFGLYKYAGLCL